MPGIVKSWHRQSALGTSPQLGVNNDSVQVRLYCFWPKAFCRNNFVTCCQGSLCPQRRQKNKEQKWEFLYLIPISPKHRGRQRAWPTWQARAGGRRSGLTYARLPLRSFLLPLRSLHCPSNRPSSFPPQGLCTAFSFA